jgi:hypothetical protein
LAQKNGMFRLPVYWERNLCSIKLNQPSADTFRVSGQIFGSQSVGPRSHFPYSISDRRESPGPECSNRCAFAFHEPPLARGFDLICHELPGDSARMRVVSGIQGLFGAMVLLIMSTPIIDFCGTCARFGFKLDDRRAPSFHGFQSSSIRIYDHRKIRLILPTEISIKSNRAIGCTINSIFDYLHASLIAHVAL